MVPLFVFHTKQNTDTFTVEDVPNFFPENNNEETQPDDDMEQDDDELVVQPEQYELKQDKLPN